MFTNLRGSKKDLGPLAQFQGGLWHSTSHALFVLNKTVDYFTNHGSNVFVSYLDCSKAFDKISHKGLFIKLIERKVPLCFLNILIFWLSNLNSKCRWQSTLSDPYFITSGVKQGGILSPNMFTLYSLHERYAENSSKKWYWLPRWLSLCWCHYVRWWLSIVSSNQGCYAYSSHPELASFRRFANSIVSSLSKANEQVLMKLLYTFSVPILTYASEVKQFSYSDMHDCNVALNDAIRCIFSYNRWESIRTLRQQFGFRDLYTTFASRRQHFLSRIPTLPNHVVRSLLNAS